jgi:transcriptional regulator of acetoin/glycerol metabolism
VDFSFGPDRTFNVYYPGQGTEKTDLRFSWPGNIRELSLPVDASELATHVISRGSGNGDTQVIDTYPNSPTAEQATYKLREVIDDYPSINVAATLEEKGTEHYRKGSVPTVIPEITLDGNIEPYLGAYWVGDRVPVAIDASAGSLYAALDGQTWRINEIDVTLSEDDNEQVRLKLGYA